MLKRSDRTKVVLALWMSLCMVSAPLIAHAETQYIIDTLTVPLRRGPSNQHKIIHAGLPSGTALEVIGTDAAAGFTNVKTNNGTEGWVPTQYLVGEPSARDRLAAAQKRIETLTAEMTNVRQGMKAEQSARNGAEGETADLNKQVKQLQGDLSEIRRVSANSVALYEEHKALKIRADELERNNTEQAVQIKSLRGNQLQVWLLFGGGLVVIGVGMGVMIKSRPKGKSGW
ncbi:MAG TPA: TIGR04211 family SH3 domain-containing protein [Steroidobacteraceae bacterium]|nr:TIGR04211 family SH3 domain-containing protein [Steroidobacteraceae bacterium]